MTAVRDASGRRDWRATLTLGPRRLAAQLLNDSPAKQGLVRAMAGLLGHIHPLLAIYDNWVASRFDRDPVSPGAAYQFGWGNADAFRFLDGDTAATATATEGWTLRSGFDLPGGFSLSSIFRSSDLTTLDTRSDRLLRERRWPDVQASLPPLGMPRWSGMTQVRLTGGIARSRIESEYGESLQGRSEESTDLPASISIAWRGTLRTSYEARLRSGRATDPTGELQPRGVSQRFSLSTSFSPPWGIALLLDRPVDVSLLGLYSSESNCRKTAVADQCVPFIDRDTRSLSLSMDTSVQDFELGAQLSYDNRRSFVGQQPGSTHFRVLLFGEMRISSGNVGR